VHQSDEIVRTACETGIQVAQVVPTTASFATCLCEGKRVEMALLTFVFLIELPPSTVLELGEANERATRSNVARELRATMVHELHVQ
jgi:hypothetical protein